MALCQQSNCNLAAWPQLADLCLAHYRELVFAKAWDAFCLAENAYYSARDNIYGVEVAMGLRPSLRDFYKLSYETQQKARPPVRRAKSSSTNDAVIVDDEGDLETDI